MSTRGTTFWDRLPPQDWQPDPHPWCEPCVSATCEHLTEPTSLPGGVELGEN